MTGKRATLAAIGLMAEVSLGCGSSAIQQGMPDAQPLSDAGADRDAAAVDDSHDATDEGVLDAAGMQAADGASCGPGMGSFVVTLAVPSVSTGSCECNWGASGADASVAGGSVDTGLDGFTVSCVPAGSNYQVECSCDNAPADMAMFGPCGGSADFAVMPGTTTDVPVAPDCPG